MSTPKPTEAEPMDVTAVDGEVVILGPDGTSGAFTPEAARRSARRLENAADSAAYTRLHPRNDDSG